MLDWVLSRLTTCELTYLALRGVFASTTCTRHSTFLRFLVPVRPMDTAAAAKKQERELDCGSSCPDQSQYKQPSGVTPCTRCKDAHCSGFCGRHTRARNCLHEAHSDAMQLHTQSIKTKLYMGINSLKSVFYIQLNPQDTNNFTTSYQTVIAEKVKQQVFKLSIYTGLFDIQCPADIS